MHAQLSHSDAQYPAFPYVKLTIETMAQSNMMVLMVTTIMINSRAASKLFTTGKTALLSSSSHLAFSPPLFFIISDIDSGQMGKFTKP